MSKGERATIAIGIIGLVGIVLQIWIALVHEEEHRAGITAAVGIALLGLVVASVNAWALQRNLRDAHRAEKTEIKLTNAVYEHGVQRAEAQRVHDEEVSRLRSENDRLVQVISRHNDEISEMSGRHQQEVEALKRKHAEDIKDERSVVIHSARWGIGGTYSVDQTAVLAGC